MLFIMDLFFRAKGGRLLPDPCLIHITSRHTEYSQSHTAGLANCKVRQTGFEATQGAFKIQQRDTFSISLLTPVSDTEPSLAAGLLIIQPACYSAGTGQSHHFSQAGTNLPFS